MFFKTIFLVNVFIYMAAISAIMAETFGSLPQPFHVRYEIVPQLHHKFIFTNPLQLTVHYPYNFRNHILHIIVSFSLVTDLFILILLI